MYLEKNVFYLAMLSIMRWISMCLYMLLVEEKSQESYNI